MPEPMYRVAAFDPTSEDFAPSDEASGWIKNKGWSLGRIQRSANRGILAEPDVDIAKWRDLTREEKGQLDGELRYVGGVSRGRVEIWMKKGPH